MMEYWINGMLDKCRNENFAEVSPDASERKDLKLSLFHQSKTPLFQVIKECL